MTSILTVRRRRRGQPRTVATTAIAITTTTSTFLSRLRPKKNRNIFLGRITIILRVIAVFLFAFSTNCKVAILWFSADAAVIQTLLAFSSFSAPRRRSQQQQQQKQKQQHQQQEPNDATNFINDDDQEEEARTERRRRRRRRSRSAFSSASVSSTGRRVPVPRSRHNYPNPPDSKIIVSLSDCDQDDDDDDVSASVSPQQNSHNSNNYNHLLEEALDERMVWDVSLPSFNMDLQNLALEDPRQAEDAVQIMTELYHQQHQQQAQNMETAMTIHTKNCCTLILPDASSYTTILDGYIQAGQLDEAQRILDFMEQQAIAKTTATATDETNATSISLHTHLAPTDLTYLLMAQAWANDVAGDFAGRSAEKATQVLRCMQAAAARIQPQQSPQQTRTAAAAATTTFGMNNTATVVSNPSSNISSSSSSSSSSSTSNLVKVWSIVVEGWCKRAGISRDAMKRAEALLDEMEDEQDSLIRPNVLTYTSYIGGLSRSQQPDMARQAEAVLERMRRHGVPPDVVAYTAVLHCYAKAVSRRERYMAVARVTSLLQEMERLYIQRHVYNVKPSLITYAAAMAALANSLDSGAPETAQAILQRMYQLSQDGIIANLKPVTVTYNAVLYALSRAPVRNRRKYAQRAEQLLQEMEQRARSGERDVAPDVRTWATVLRAWARSRQPDAAVQAQRVLDDMESKYRQGTSLVRPNYVCFTTVMGAWGYSKEKEALDKMDAILRRMETEYEETLEADVRPNTVSYVTCIDAFVRRNDADSPHRAEAIVQRMTKFYEKGLGHVKPTHAVFNCVLNAWSKSNELNAPRKAEEIFQWMESQYQSTGDHLLRPNQVSLCAVLNAWANHATNGGAARALQIWEHHRDRITDEERGFRLIIAIPNTVIKAVARSRDPDAVRTAEAILLRLEEDYRAGISSALRPDVTTYSSVINACAYCAGDATKRAEALETALRTFDKLCAMPDESPNNIVYGTVFKAIQNLMPVGEEREELVQTLFDQCCDEGHVDSFVLTQVRYANPSLYRNLVEGPCGLGGPNKLHDPETVLRNVPVEWTASVVSR